MEQASECSQLNYSSSVPGTRYSSDHSTVYANFFYSLHL